MGSLSAGGSSLFSHLVESMRFSLHPFDFRFPDYFPNLIFGSIDRFLIVGMSPLVCWGSPRLETLESEVIQVVDWSAPPCPTGRVISYELSSAYPSSSTAPVGVAGHVGCEGGGRQEPAAKIPLTKCLFAREEGPPRLFL